MSRPKRWQDMKTPQQRLTAYFIDTCREQGLSPDGALIGMVAHNIRKMLEESDDPIAAEVEARGVLREFVTRYNAEGYPTGSRFVRGAGAGTYLEDPLGTERAPYDVPWKRPNVKKILEAIRERA